MNRRHFLALPVALAASNCGDATGIDLGPVPRTLELFPGTRVMGWGTVSWEQIHEAMRVADDLFRGVAWRTEFTRTFIQSRLGESSPLRVSVSWVEGQR